MPAQPDYYAILEISPAASPEVITSAYRSLARKYHPDANPSPDANAKMKAINAAYDVLSDRNKRASYDRQRAAAAKPAPPQSPPKPSPQAAPPPLPANAPSSFSIGNVLSSPAFGTFIIAFIGIFAALTILAETLLQRDFDGLIIPASLVTAAVVALVRSRRSAR